MKNVFAGLAFFVTGLVIWVFSSFGVAISEVVSSEESGLGFFMKIGFLFMIIGPMIFWIIRPLEKVRKKRESKVLLVLNILMSVVTAVFAVIIFTL